MSRGSESPKRVAHHDIVPLHSAALDVDVPRIAILGNQSSGKSSVIEAISGISLPRSRGTCTRCPIEVRLVRDVNVDWTCQVAIRFADFTACQSDSDSKAQAPTEIPFGGAITDPKMVEDRIRRAQLAALTPDVRTRQGGLQTFLAASAESIGQNPTIEFTKNTICVTIQDPTGVNLSFVDLPGLISNAGQNKSDANIKLIEDVAIQTISQPNCLILLTITCTDDIQNQSGAALARQVDPQGLRTIGVLTKTDAIQEGDHSAWFDLLCGRRETLKYGYYAVKNPSTQQLQHGIAYEAARTAEQDFFKGQHWIQLPAHVQQRLGVNHLTSRLSALLKGLIQQQLPGMLANMNQALGETRARLDKLPEHVNEADSVRFVSDKCNAVAAAVKAAVQGSKGTGSSALLRQIRQQAIRTFKDDIVCVDETSAWRQDTALITVVCTQISGKVRPSSLAKTPFTGVASGERLFTLSCTSKRTKIPNGSGMQLCLGRRWFTLLRKSVR